MLVQSRMLSDGVRPVRDALPLHIYFVGTYFDHEAFGFLQALHKLGRVWSYVDKNGHYGINSSFHSDGSPALESDNQHMLDEIRALHREHEIDFVIGTFVASSIAVETLVSIRSLGIPVINYAMDDRLPHHWRKKNDVRMGAIGLVEGVDLTLQTTKEFVLRYLAEGCPCVYWPFASDPQIYIPAGVKDMDVVFVGNNYGKRGALVQGIESAGIRVDCYGGGFPNGHLSGNRVAGMFARAKIILGTGLVGHSSSIVTLKLRDFDAPMAGSLYITSHNADLAEFFDIGNEILTYTSIPDCISKIRRFLADPEGRERIASAGRTRAVKDHTWDNRISVLLDLLRESSPLR